jgi:hypothetical protein
MAECVDAAIETTEPSLGQSVFDHAGAEAQFQELASGDHAVLKRRQVAGTTIELGRVAS